MEQNKKKCRPGAPLWMTTFADLMTLLMCFFVLLLSFSEMDVLKFKQLAGSMSAAFGVQRDIKVKEIPKGTSIIAKEFSPGRPSPTAVKVMRQHTADDTKRNLVFSKGKGEDGAEKDKMKKRLEKLKKDLHDQISAGNIEVTGDNKRTIIRIREKGSFPSGSDRLRPGFEPVIKKIAATLFDLEGRIQISGHTDNIPIATFRFKSNWQLSTARAVSILNAILKVSAIPSQRFIIQGHADNDPLVPNTTAQNRAINRRVEIIVIKEKAKPEVIQSLIKFSE
jgi:chemotaxis protein MotB